MVVETTSDIEPVLHLTSHFFTMNVRPKRQDIQQTKGKLCFTSMFDRHQLGSPVAFYSCCQSFGILCKSKKLLVLHQRDDCFSVQIVLKRI